MPSITANHVVPYGKIHCNRKTLLKAISSLHESERDDLVHLARKLHDDYRFRLVREDWIDCGHTATYGISKLSNISSRHFNEIYYDKENRLLIKKSADKEKLNNEFLYYENCPEDLKRYVPFSKKLKEGELAMEFISQPNLAELYLHGNLGPATWEKITQELKRVYDDFYKRESLKQACSWLYEDKTMRREEMFSKLSHKKRYSRRIYNNNEFKVNGINHVT